MSEARLHPGILRKIETWRKSPLAWVKECIIWPPGQGLSPQQMELFHNFNNEKRITIRSGHGCFGFNTIFPLYKGGFELVQNLKVGDILIGDDNESRKIIKTFSGIDNLYEIRYKNGLNYTVNSEHTLVLVKRRNPAGKIVEVKIKEYLAWTERKKKDYFGYKVGIDYPDRNVIIPPYLLGLWLGDGDKYGPRIINIDHEIIVMLAMYAEDSNLILHENTDEKTWSFSSKEGKNRFTEGLRYYNLERNKHIPPVYLFNSKDKRLQLLAGLLDSDGYLNEAKSSFEITQKRKGLAEDIQFLATSCGMNAVVKPCKKTWKYEGIKKVGTYYRLHISRNIENIPTQVRRKQVPLGLPRQRNRLRYSFDIISKGKGTYYGFTVDKNHRILLEDGTVARNCGKDTAAALLSIYFMSTRPFAKVVVTAPTNRQLYDIYWSELAKWFRQSRIQDEFVQQKDIFFQKDYQKEWWIRIVSPQARATKDEQAETLAGFHGDHLLIIGDEASGIRDPVFIPLEGAMTQEDNKCMLIGNMTKNHGYFYDTHFNQKIAKNWYKVHWDSRKSPLVTKEMVEFFRIKYGEDSSVFAIRVVGDPPRDDEMTLIPLSWAQQCIGNEVLVAEDEPRYLGVDVARYGDDKSVILPRKGLRIEPWEEFKGMNTIDLGGHVNQAYQELNAEGIAVDEIGVGAGVTDWLMKHKRLNTFGVNVAWASSDKTKYDKLRDELWVKARERCMRCQYSFPDNEESQELCNELAAPRYTFNALGGYRVEGKREMKLRGIMSPNKADALCLTEYFANIAYKVWPKSKKKDKSLRPWEIQNTGDYGEYAWMLA